jgi:hypothetical protein
MLQAPLVKVVVKGGEKETIVCYRIIHLFFGPRREV